MTSKVSNKLAPVIGGGGGGGDSLIGGTSWTPTEGGSIQPTGFVTAENGTLSNNGWDVSANYFGKFTSAGGFAIGAIPQGIAINFTPMDFAGGDPFYSLSFGFSSSDESVVVGFRMLADNNFQQISFILGNLAINDVSSSVTLNSGQWSNTDQFAVGIDNTGANGCTLYLLQNGNVIHSYSLALPYTGTIDRQWLSTKCANLPSLVYLLQVPTLPEGAIWFYDTSFIGDGNVDQGSYPADRFNKSFECVGMATPLMSPKGMIDNGNIVIFNSNGEILTPLI